MKLTDITATKESSNNAIPSSENADSGYEAASHEACPELVVLLTARTANSIVNCKLLARDELELANLILNQIDVDPHYAPSHVLLAALRAINAKLALC